MKSELAVKLVDITKTFGSTVANSKVNLDLKFGEVLALLGENGSGKTTLVNMLAGLYYPDSGEVFIKGEKVSIKSPKDSFDLGIGMIHQHFKLIDVFTTAENIILTLPETEKYNKKVINERISEICKKYGFEIDLNKKIYNMSVSEKQTVEILKVLVRGSDILILDEPTAVLTPQEIEKLFKILKTMRDDGKAIIIITHKLNEVLEVSNRVSILRKGEYIDTVITEETTSGELTEKMVGRKVDLSIKRNRTKFNKKLLEVTDLSATSEEGYKVLNRINFCLKAGEILGIAGISGSGQRELCECVYGLYKNKRGVVNLYREGKKFNILGMNPEQISKKGFNIGFVPEDRLGMGLVGDLGIDDNMILKNYKGDKGIFIDYGKSKRISEKVIEDLEIKTPGIKTPVKKLSGGNIQKVLVGREIESYPEILIVAYPVRGLDINSSYTIYDLLNREKERGVGVIFVGEDLDVLMDISDRLAVMYNGQIMNIVDPREVTKDDIGLLMMGKKQEVSNV
ncbi:ABC transporter ATP-binding protein [Miniphocaeibacter massiliensis]|uniref:ABC transporter ATP-binding protein n=1 Tax=Miniphocaeibacter massiliensis TaxID=2041841 RepID=UPI000C1BFDDF|nr:ABC transporter ATP-binding protein [Miniphocaeibacter massiliensis]